VYCRTLCIWHMINLHSVSTLCGYSPFISFSTGENTLKFPTVLYINNNIRSSFSVNVAISWSQFHIYTTIHYCFSQLSIILNTFSGLWNSSNILTLIFLFYPTNYFRILMCISRLQPYPTYLKLKFLISCILSYSYANITNLRGTWRNLM
jgi:hypothetical protein